MQEPYGKGLAKHIGPESCGTSGNTGTEALTGVRVTSRKSGFRSCIIRFYASRLFSGRRRRFRKESLMGFVGPSETLPETWKGNL